MSTPAVASASAEIMQGLIAAYRNDRGVHAETVIGAAAALAGEFALKAVEPRLPDSGWVMSERASDFIFGEGNFAGAGLWPLIREGARRAGAEEAALPDPSEVAGRIARAVGGSPYPPLSIPEEHFPHEWSPNACPRLRAAVEQVMASHRLDKTDAARAVTLAIPLLMMEVKAVLSAAIAATLALEVMVGVSHMPPLRQAVG